MINNICVLFWEKPMADDFTKFIVDTKQHSYRVLFLGLVHTHRQNCATHVYSNVSHVFHSRQETVDL